MSRRCLIAAAALVAFSGCFADVNLGDRSEAGTPDAGGGIDACICGSPQTNACGNCPGAATCDRAAGVVCPCSDPTDCPAGYSCVFGPTATEGECMPQGDPDASSIECEAGDPDCNATR